MEEEKVRRRYWVSCPTIVNDPAVSGIFVEDAKEKTRRRTLEDRLEDEFKFNHVSTGFVYKTWSLEDARKKATSAREVVKEAGYEGLADAVNIMAQPVCPRCGELARFSDFHCSSCGTELLPKGYVNF